MASIARWNPFREMNALRTLMDQMTTERDWPARSWKDKGNGLTYGLALAGSETCCIRKGVTDKAKSI